MRKLRFFVMAYFVVYLFFLTVVLIDGVRNLMRSDIEIFLYGGLVSALLGFISLAFPQKNDWKGFIKENVISLWIERKKLEEKKRIDELKK